MFHLMKSIFFRFRKDCQLFLTILGLLLLMMVSLMALDIMNEGSGGITETLGGNLCMAFAAALVLICFTVCNQICSSDFLEKTIYLEVMSGQSRNNLFFARLFVSCILSYICCVGSLVLALFLGQCFLPWGIALSWEDILIRCVLLIFPVIKICCEMMAVFFVLGPKLGKFFPGVILGVEILQMTLVPVASAFTQLFSMHNIYTLFYCVKHATYTLENAESINTYSAQLSREVLFTMPIFAIIVSVLSCVIALRYIQKDDFK